METTIELDPLLIRKILAWKACTKGTMVIPINHLSTEMAQRLAVETNSILENDKQGKPNYLFTEGSV